MSIITRSVNRHSIDVWLGENTLPRLRFYYVDAPPGFRYWKLGKLYYARWQQMVVRVAKHILMTDPFDLAHHITAASINYPIFLQKLPVPLVYGPLGGGEAIPSALWAGGGPIATAYEWIRVSRQKTVRWDPRIQSTMAKAACILAANPDTKLFVPHRYRDKTILMPMVGIETALVDQLSHHNSSGCRIYTAGRLLHWKGFHLAVQAFACVAAQHPEATLTIIGDGPQRARLEHLARIEGINDRIRITGWLPRSEALHLAKQSDVLLFPSLRDSGGMVVLEAMAAGKPVICLDAGGPAVIVTPECGIKVPVITPEQVVTDLAEALRRLMSDPNLCQQMGNAAIQRVLDEFVWEKKAEKMFAIYQEVVALPSLAE